MISSGHLTGMLRDVLAALDEAKVPDDLREVAFAKAFDLTAGVPAASSTSPAATPPAGGGNADHGDPIGRIAAKLGIPPDQAGQVFDVDDDGPHLTVSPSAFDSKKRFAMQEIIRVVSAARQALELEEFTPTKELRRVCEDRGVLDSANFSSALAGLDGDGMRLRLRGQTKRQGL